ncbi:tyrosine-type recombinase/integrase [Bradyrhizobium stylosanthis]|uniref:tyrosine-type recombinase/integrase n=1 Tax=Bradyrhizobium stylosanthis TaxID=1803665 RepID=UPI000AC67BFC|nr:site-specific integrase [Bradyrhizobium stylosanthis]
MSSFNLKSPSARAKLAVRKRPYRQHLERGLTLGYRRNQGPGTWCVIAPDGHGSEWLKAFGSADDGESVADGKTIFSYKQAAQEARRLVRGGDADKVDANEGKKFVTLDEALTNYGTDLEKRGGNPYNATSPREHLPASLLSKPVPLLDATELRKWRDSLHGLTPSSVNRYLSSINAALNLAVEQDSRIQNSQAWKIGLKRIPGATESNNVILVNDQVRTIVRNAYARDHELGLLTDVQAQGGNRPSQAARLRVRDLLNHRTSPKLMMPKSSKGGGAKAKEKRVERFPVPITPTLAARLAKHAEGRKPGDRLLLQSNGKPWGRTDPKDPSRDAVGVADDYGDDFREVVKASGLDPDEVTMYALRHSSIVRQLMKGVHQRVVAANHDTSVVEIERTYSKYITDHTDAMTRAALLDDETTPPDNVVQLAA